MATMSEATSRFFVQVTKSEQSRKKSIFLLKNKKTRREMNSIFDCGSRYVSGNYHEQKEPCGVSKAQNPPSFCGHKLVASKSSRNFNIAQWVKSS